MNGIHTSITNEDYSGALRTFINWCKVATPDELLEGDITTIEDRIMSFIKDQQSKGIAFATIRQRLSGLRHFYDVNRVVINWKFLIKKGLGPGNTPKRDRAYKHSELAAMTAGAKIRDTAIVLTFASTGIREAAMSPLNFSHITEVMTTFGKIYRFKGMRVATVNISFSVRQSALKLLIVTKNIVNAMERR